MSAVPVQEIVSKEVEDLLERMSIAILMVGKVNLSDEALANATTIFAQVIMNKMYDLQDAEDIPFENRREMASACGNEIRELIIKFTGVTPVITVY